MSRGVWVVSAFALTAALYHSLFNDPSRVGAILEREMEEIKEQQQKLVQAKESPSSRAEDSDDAINLVLVSCGSKDRLEEVEVLLKSAVAFSRQKVNFIVFTDSLGKEITDVLSSFNATGRFPPITLDLRDATQDYHGQQFSDLREGFAPCATLRLFFPKILGSEYRQILYVDTDVIFLADPARIWRHFNLMSPTQTVAMARENLNDKYDLYKYSLLPQPMFGLNSGVMLMDLHKMRTSKWAEKLYATYQTLKPYLIFHDQSCTETSPHLVQLFGNAESIFYDEPKYPNGCLLWNTMWSSYSSRILAMIRAFGLFPAALSRYESLNDSRTLSLCLSLSSKDADKIVYYDLLNTIFKYFPDEFYILPWTTNVRPDQCVSSQSVTNEDNIEALHCNRGSCLTGKHQFGSALSYALKNAEFMVRNPFNVIYALNIRSVLIPKPALFQRTYQFFAKLTLAQLTVDDDDNEDEVATRFGGLETLGEDDVCRHIVPRVLRALQELQ